MWLFDLFFPQFCDSDMSRYGYCLIYFFFNSAILICQGMNIPKYFRKFFGLRDDESRQYFLHLHKNIWAAISENIPSDICAQQRLRSVSHSHSLIRIYTGTFWIAKDTKFFFMQTMNSYKTAQMCMLCLCWARVIRYLSVEIRNYELCVVIKSTLCRALCSRW